VNVEDRRLMTRWQNDGDRAARDELVRRHLRLAKAAARRFAGRGEPIEDLEQVAAIALVKAIDRFDLDREIAISTYATATIVGELRRHFRDRAWAIHVPRGIQELLGRLGRIEEEMTREGRAPTVRQLAAAAGCEVEEVVEALGAASARSTRPLDPWSADEHGLDETLGLPESGFEQADVRQLLSGPMGGLDERARTVLRLRFEEDLSQSEIALRLGCSQMHVSRILRATLDELSESMAPA